MVVCLDFICIQKNFEIYSSIHYRQISRSVVLLNILYFESKDIKKAAAWGEGHGCHVKSNKKFEKIMFEYKIAYIFYLRKIKLKYC